MTLGIEWPTRKKKAKAEAKREAEEAGIADAEAVVKEMKRLKQEEEEPMTTAKTAADGEQRKVKEAGPQKAAEPKKDAEARHATAETAQGKAKAEAQTKRAQEVKLPEVKQEANAEKDAEAEGAKRAAKLATMLRRAEEEAERRASAAAENAKVAAAAPQPAPAAAATAAEEAEDGGEKEAVGREGQTRKEEDPREALAAWCAAAGDPHRPRYEVQISREGPARGAYVARVLRGRGQVVGLGHGPDMLEAMEAAARAALAKLRDA